MKIIIIVLIFISILFGKCLTNKEIKSIKIEIKRIDSYNDIIPNYINCKNQVAPLNKFVCNNEDYLLMFNYLSKVNVYKYEDIYKHELNHEIFNKDNMKYWHENFKEDNYNLCFDIKRTTMSMSGGDTPYNIIMINKNEYTIQENKNGLVLTNGNSYKMYLGKSCDLLDSNKENGIWYHKGNDYFMKIGKNTLKFSTNKNLDISRNKCKKTTP